jgi:alkylhydroperoxidase family enzyme
MQANAHTICFPIQPQGSEMPRIPYLNRDDLPEESREYFASLQQPDGRTMNLHRVMAYRPKLMQLRTAFARALNGPDTIVPPRLRELAQLTVGRITASVYEFHHHVERAQRAGLTKEHIMALPVWERHPLFSDEERAVMRYAEEMTRDARVSDATFDALRAFLSEAQIIELTLVISHYNATARFLEALHVLPDEDGGA